MGGVSEAGQRRLKWREEGVVRRRSGAHSHMIEVGFAWGRFGELS